MYSYETEKERLFTDDGQRTFLRIRDNVKRLIRESGAVRLQEAIKCVTGDSWVMLACIDRMVELGEIKEVTAKGSTMSQHRIFTEIL